MLHQSKYRFGRGSQGGRDNGTVYAFDNRPTNSVSVENIADRVDIHELISLFNTLIGKVRNSQEIKDGSSHRLDITFCDRDTATKALCMNGYNVGGIPLAVSALTMSSPVSRPGSKVGDDRRNLYVLGLPFALTKIEFASLFSQYGTVSHCVILATVDNSSRRRGFVVMSTHEEAKNAMSRLTRTQIKGHTIDVSWAVVQRSQGFLDGGDRAVILDTRSHLPTSSPTLNDAASLPSSDIPEASLCSFDSDPSSLMISLLPTPILVVSNLPTVLFSQAQDLHPLFYPYGHIEKLEIVHVSPHGTMSVVVQYTTSGVAQEAKDSLNGQVYGNFQLEARYISPVAPTGMHTRSNSGFTALNTLGTIMPAPLSSGPLDYIQPRATLNRSGSFDDLTFIKTTTNALSCNTGNVELPPPFMRHNSYGSLSAKHSPISAITPPFTPVLNDINDSNSTSAASIWGAQPAQSAYSTSIADPQRHFSLIAPHFNAL